ncbi:MAG TPA: hypothetical protein VF543_10430 [Pyrinomonadaceae bacterium]
MKAATSKRARSRFTWSTSLMAVVILAITPLGCRTLMSRAKGKVSNVSCKAGVGYVKGQLDAGIDVIVTIKNVGEAGFINIKSELSTSEGEWTRSQDVQFSADESRTLTYFFDEPTINAKNIQCRVGVSPRAN